jgi:hypothetical protein
VACRARGYTRQESVSYACAGVERRLRSVVLVTRDDVADRFRKRTRRLPAKTAGSDADVRIAPQSPDLAGVGEASHVRASLVEGKPHRGRHRLTD